MGYGCDDKDPCNSWTSLEGWVTGQCCMLEHFARPLDSHVINNEYTKWQSYTIGGADGAIIISQGNQFVAADGACKEITKREQEPESIWREWTWRSEGDLQRNIYLKTSTTSHPVLERRQRAGKNKKQDPIKSTSVTECRHVHAATPPTEHTAPASSTKESGTESAKQVLFKTKKPFGKKEKAD
ncbi:pectate lyase P59 [Artemisia annua]|uniref:Pectate lyase P59 n=1 Tax=Artemisia annua TaxID=35608 RepID=A0A2U1NBC9_ARTAN|nr:pectate lyase P59 [Artemisia annua]